MSISAEYAREHQQEPAVLCCRTEAGTVIEAHNLEDPAIFDDLVDSLLTNRFGVADPYMTIADFQDYARAQKVVAATYRDTRKFTNMSLVNIAKAGIFSSDRAVEEYAENIWNLKK